MSSIGRSRLQGTREGVRHVQQDSQGPEEGERDDRGEDDLHLRLGGRPRPVAPGTVFEYKAPDMYNRPWAEIWEEFHEQGMQRPEEEDIFSFD